MSDFAYLPILKWKQGEQRALIELDASDRKSMMPIIEFGPLKRSATQTAREALIQETLKAAKQLHKAGYASTSCAVDVTAMSSLGGSSSSLLAFVVQQLRQQNIRVVPAVHPEMLTVESGRQKIQLLTDCEAFVLRVRVSSVLHTQVAAIARDLRSIVGSKTPIHIVLDNHDIVGRQPDAVASESEPYITEAQRVTGTTTVTLAGGSFPHTLAGLSKGNVTIERVEWQAWEKLRGKQLFKSLRFGDYAVTNPRLLVVEDPTKMNPAAAIRYARHSNWLLLKAGGTKTGGFDQYNDLCRLLVKSPDYCGPGFSYGDSNYHDHARPGAKTGNYTTWRRDATSHHLVLTSRALA